VTAEGALGVLLALNVAWFGFGSLNWLMLALHIQHRRLLEEERLFEVEQIMEAQMRGMRDALRRDHPAVAEMIYGPKETLH
jgi:hypothetical protein